MTMHAKSLPRHAPILPKFDAEDLAADVVVWFGHCLRFLAPDNWTFAVDSDGKYLIGELNTPEPNRFGYAFENWTLTLRCLPERVRIPHCSADLTEARERLHKSVTIVLMNLTSSAKAGKLLEKLRKEHDLEKLRKADIM